MSSRCIEKQRSPGNLRPNASSCRPVQLFFPFIACLIYAPWIWSWKKEKKKSGQSLPASGVIASNADLNHMEKAAAASNHNKWLVWFALSSPPLDIPSALRRNLARKFLKAGYGLREVIEFHLAWLVPFYLDVASFTGTLVTRNSMLNKGASCDPAAPGETTSNQGSGYHGDEC